MESWIVLIVILIIVYVIKNSTTEGKVKSELSSVFSILRVNNDGVIPLDISKEDLSRGLEEYYKVLQKVFDSETVEERKIELNLMNGISGKSSPSKALARVFFDRTGLYEALVILCGELDYIKSGSGWINYKKCLSNALGKGSVGKKKDKDKILIKFNNDLYLEAEKSDYNAYSYEPDDNPYGPINDYRWSVVVYFKGSEVLSCFGVPNFERHGKPEFNQPKKESVLLSKFKPDYWIIDIRKVAQKYSENIEEMKLVEATKQNKDSIFR